MEYISSHTEQERVAGTYKKIHVSSAAFGDNELIPRRHTCDGKNVNPALNFDHIPSGTHTLTLILDDPDAPLGTWTHWMIWNIPVTHHLKEDYAPGVQGINDFGKNCYSGPCPSKGTHRYFFKVYALDCQLDLSEGSSKISLDKAMSGHILGFGKLIGLYNRE